MTVETKEQKTDPTTPATTAATPSTTAPASSSAPANPILASDNVWSSLLKKALRKNKENNSTLVVMGVPKSGKSSLLAKFSDRIVNDQSNEYLLQYSYLLVKNKYAQDKDDVLAHMNIWQFDDIQQLSLLPLLLTGSPSSSVADIATSLSTIPNPNKSDTTTPTQPSAPSTTVTQPSSSPTLTSTSHPTHEPMLNGISPTDAAATLDNTIYVVVVDLSSPATILTELNSWLQGVSLVTERIMNTLTPEQQAKLKNKISRHVQTYYANLSNSSTTATGISITPSDPITPSVPIQPDIPPINLGIPVLIVGTKADTFTRKGVKPVGTTPAETGGVGGDEKFEFITRRLRKLALKYGAGLIYTSSAGRGTNIDTLQAHILHRLYAFPLPHPSKVVGNEDDWTIHIPSGADNADLIDSVSSVPTKSGWDDNTSFENIFAAHKRRSSTVTASAINSATSIRALDNVLFFKNLKVQLEQGPQRRDEALRDIVHAQVKSRSSLGATPSTSSTSTAPVSSPTGTTATASASAAAKAKAASASKPKLNPKGQIAVKQFFRSLLTNNPKSDATKSAQQKTVRANAEQAIASMAEGNEPEDESGNTEEGDVETEASS